MHYLRLSLLEILQIIKNSLPCRFFLPLWVAKDGAKTSSFSCVSTYYALFCDLDVAESKAKLIF